MLVVALSSLAFITRIMRGEMLEVLGQDYIRTAKAKGASRSASVNYKHGLRNAILVIVATIGGVLPSLISGAGTVEYVLRWPGYHAPFYLVHLRTRHLCRDGLF